MSVKILVSRVDSCDIHSFLFSLVHSFCLVHFNILSHQLNDASLFEESWSDKYLKCINKKCVYVCLKDDNFSDKLLVSIG